MVNRLFKFPLTVSIRVNSGRSLTESVGGDKQKTKPLTQPLVAFGAARGG